MHEQIYQMKISLEKYRSLLCEREILEKSGETNTLSAIDRILDTFPEDLEEKFVETRSIYLEKYHLQWKQTHLSLHQKRNELQKTLSLLSPFYRTLELGKETILSAKKRKILDYIFGRNPKVVLAYHLFDAEKRAREILPLMPSPIASYLKHFIHESSNPWNHKLYKGEFLDLLPPITRIMEEMQDEIEGLDSEIKKLEEQQGLLFK